MSSRRETLEKTHAQKKEDARVAAHKKRIAIERRESLLMRLLTGQKLSAEEGREIYWTCVCNAEALMQNPMTGNSWTYHVLGQRKFAEEQLWQLKCLDIGLYQDMEREAINRLKKETD